MTFLVSGGHPASLKILETIYFANWDSSQLYKHNKALIIHVSLIEEPGQAGTSTEPGKKYLLSQYPVFFFVFVCLRENINCVTLASNICLDMAG